MNNSTNAAGASNTPSTPTTAPTPSTSPTTTPATTPSTPAPPVESNLVIHARRELELIGEDPETISGYVKVIQAFADMGHSGGSASVAIPTIHQLLQYKNLTPLTDSPDEWVFHDATMWPPDGVWQNIRNGDAFSTDGGKTYYLLSEGTRGRHANAKHVSRVSDA